LTLPYSKCIDLNEYKDPTTQKEVKVGAVVRIYRAEGYTTDGSSTTSITGAIDPMQASQWQLLSGLGNISGMQDYIYNYATWNTLLQIRNTTSTDLAFRYDRPSNKLYINVSSNSPKDITIEYIPRYDDVAEIVSDYWIDNLLKMSLALTKITVGRIRTRFTHSNALWTQDGQTLLDEGKEEYKALQEYLQANTMLTYGLD